MPIAMVTLSHARNGDWFARKGIPADVRPAYKAAFGVSQEERFRRPGSMSANRAKQELREWDATVSSRIEALRGAAKGQGRTLTQKECHALSGEWYSWFLAQHEDEPGAPGDWDLVLEHFRGAAAAFEDGTDESEPGEDVLLPPAMRRRVQARLSEIARVPTFLAEHDTVLTPEATEALLDVIGDDFVAACAVLRRRAGGDFGHDSRPQRFPKLPGIKPERLAGMTCWPLFDAWVHERKPAASTVDRWRSVFLALEAHFADRDIATISQDEAIEWKGTLVTQERSPRVANEVWLVAARTVFEWALDNKKIEINPFKGVRVAVARQEVRPRDREFTEAEWQKILTASLEPAPPRMAAYNAAARRWVPWLCAYTGARPGEMTQLRAEDVFQHGDTWVVRITPDAGTVKSGPRTVPLHAHLIEQGFIEFVKGQRGPLFCNPKARRKERLDPVKPGQGPWVKARDKLAEWVREIGVDDRNISPNHAWRHTFKHRAARAKIEKGIRDAMCGHKPATVGDKYELPTADDLIEAMKAFPRYEIQSVSITATSERPHNSKC